jgi:hypothetical protein
MVSWRFTSRYCVLLARDGVHAKGGCCPLDLDDNLSQYLTGSISCIHDTHRFWSVGAWTQKASQASCRTFIMDARQTEWYIRAYIYTSTSSLVLRVSRLLALLLDLTGSGSRSPSAFSSAIG